MYAYLLMRHADRSRFPSYLDYTDREEERRKADQFIQ